ncbi:hypothetical protein L7F22_054894 [Adiantum nelumboides]|nr:hypothetical protein [Adiantum nelumboides]
MELHHHLTIPQWSLPTYFLPTLLTTCLLALIIALLVLIKATILKSNLKRLPPGPPGFPLIGHLHLLGKNPHQSLYELSKVHGPLMTLRLGSVPIVVASSPAMAKQILQTHDSTFANRVRTITSDRSVYGGASGITFSDSGPYWRSLRQLVAMQFFSAKRIASFEHLRTMEFNVSDFMPWLACLDLQGLRSHATQIGLKMKLAFQSLIDHRREIRKGVYDPPQDLLDILLADHNVSDDDIQAMFLDMFGGGSDTSSLLTEWALAELMANPDAMRRAEEEVRAVVGEGRPVAEADLGSLPFLRAVAKETMRLHPVLPFLVPHRASHSCDVNGYEVAAGTHVFVNTWAISRDPLAWPGPHSPLHFCPDRFLDTSDDTALALRFHFLPFGAGRRTCPGSSLGLLHFHLLLASLLHAFHWSTSSPHPPDLSEQFGIVMTKATPLLALASPKPPATLY